MRNHAAAVPRNAILRPIRASRSAAERRRAVHGFAAGKAATAAAATAAAHRATAAARKPAVSAAPDRWQTRQAERPD